MKYLIALLSLVALAGHSAAPAGATRIVSLDDQVTTCEVSAAASETALKIWRKYTNVKDANDHLRANLQTASTGDPAEPAIVKFIVNEMAFFYESEALAKNGGVMIQVRQSDKRYEQFKTQLYNVRYKRCMSRTAELYAIE